jgi:20S proteasome alpha/beta subunit
VHQLGKYGIAYAGSGDMAGALLNEFQKRNLGDQSNVDDLATEISKVSADRFAEWFRDIRPADRSPVLLLLAGYRTIAGGTEPLLYTLNSQANFAPGINPEMTMAGVPQYAVYLFHRYYDPSITLERARALAEYLIAETASQDPKVGGPIRIAEVTPSGYRELTDHEVSAISAANAALNTNLRSFFLTGGAP